MKTVLCFSGGVDSTVALAGLLADGHEVICLSVLYGQRHAREIDAAREIAAHYGVEHVVADLSNASPLFNGSALTDAISPLSGAATVVPNRNMVFISLAGALAVSRDAEYVAFGPHAGDAAVYPDCRPEFVAAARFALTEATRSAVELIAPLLRMTKAEIVQRGADMVVPFAVTYSCYAGGAVHCGVCGACQGRRAAFSEANVEDLTEYEAWS